MSKFVLSEADTKHKQEWRRPQDAALNFICSKNCLTLADLHAFGGSERQRPSEYHPAVHDLYAFGAQHRELALRSAEAKARRGPA